MGDLYKEFGVPLFVKTQKNEKFYQSHQPGRNIVKWLFSEAGFSMDMVDPELLKALFLKKDHELLRQYRAGLQEVLNSIYQANINDNYSDDYLLGKDRELQIDAIITAALAMLPYTEPDHNSQIEIPTKIDGSWKIVSFNVEKIQLTSSIFGAPYYAYGLVPTSEYKDTLACKLLFMGTNVIPTHDGCHHSMMADLIPGHSVGEHLYKIGEHKITQWIVSHSKTSISNPRIIEAIGQSLGGSLAIITHLFNPATVLAKAFNPPALLKSLEKSYKRSLLRMIDAGQKIVSDPITIYTQKDDPIWEIGNWLPENSRIYQISSDIGDKMNYLAKHKDCFATHSARHNLKFKELNPKTENSRFSRTIITLIWQSITVPVFLLNALLMMLKAIYNLLILNVLTNAQIQKCECKFTTLYYKDVILDPSPLSTMSELECDLKNKKSGMTP